MVSKVSMKYISIGITLITIILLAIIIPVYIFEQRVIDFEDETLSAHLVINNNLDFVDNGFLGNGTKSDPYLIQNLEITTTKDCGIVISKTSKSFTIRNCTITAIITGINITSIAMGTCQIYNNTITTGNIEEFSWYYGIYVYNADSIIIENNLCFNSYQYYFYRVGINVIQSSNTIIRNNSCQNQWRGLECTSSAGVIANNTLSQNDIGIYLISCQDTDVLENNCSFNYYSGINLKECGYSLVKQNIIEKNSDVGIVISDCISIIIAFNNLRHEGINIHFYFSSYSIIHHNNFFKIENNTTQSTQAIEYGEDNTWYDIGTHEGNYWSDLIWEVGVVYHITGSENNTDPYPLDSPVGY